MRVSEQNNKQNSEKTMLKDLCKCRFYFVLCILIRFTQMQIFYYSLFLSYAVEWNSVKAILIGFSLTGINLFSGTFAMINYTADIFKASGSDLDPHISSIVIAVIQILGVYGSTNLVDRVGRKTLLIFSTTGAFIGLTLLGVYSYLSYELRFDLSSYNWMPLASFSLFVFISCFGILPLPFIVLTEILPAKVRFSLLLSFFCAYYYYS